MTSATRCSRAPRAPGVTPHIASDQAQHPSRDQAAEGAVAPSPAQLDEAEEGRRGEDQRPRARRSGRPRPAGTTWAFQTPPRLSRLPSDPNGVSGRAANNATPTRSAGGVVGCSSAGNQPGQRDDDDAERERARPAPPRDCAARPQQHRRPRPRPRAAPRTPRRAPQRRARRAARRRTGAVRRGADRGGGHPWQRGVADENRPLPEPQPLGDVRVPGVEGCRGRRPPRLDRLSSSRAAPQPATLMMTSRTASWTTSPGTIRDSSATSRSLGTARGIPSRPSSRPVSGSRGTKTMSRTRT